MTVYVEGHGTEVTGSTTFVPEDMRLHFYAEEGEDVATAVTVQAVATGGQITPRETKQPLEPIPNYALFRLSSQEYGHTLALAQCGLDVRYIGETIGRDGIKLCEASCPPEGRRHTCGGLLQLLDGHSDVFLLSCRSAESEDSPPASPPHPADEARFTAYERKVREFLITARLNPARAWQHLNDLGKRNHADAIDRQELQVMLLQDTRVSTWATQYSAKAYLAEHGALAFYRLYRAEPADTRAVLRKDDALEKAIAGVEKTLYRVEELISAGETATALDWWNAGLQETERRDAMAIDQQYRDGIITSLVLTEPGTGDDVDWAAVDKHNAAVLAALREGGSTPLLLAGDRLLLGEDDAWWKAARAIHTSGSPACTGELVVRRDEHDGEPTIIVAPAGALADDQRTRSGLQAAFDRLRDHLPERVVLDAQ
ncbi:putative adhesin [Lentzea sp. NPDC051208]|uniref:putative adhesin n=1 Tax=Lentzea sp. NPDC051208 TaxID=3154642 RepID=UPI0034202901